MNGATSNVAEWVYFLPSPMAASVVGQGEPQLNKFVKNSLNKFDFLRKSFNGVAI